MTVLWNTLRIIKKGGGLGWAELILEYLRVFVSWPVAVVAIAALFRAAIERLIDRIRSVRGVGVDIQAPQLPERPAQDVNPPPPALPAGLALTPQQHQQLIQVFQAERAAARIWEYRYLNYFLARSSQVVLNWLSSLPQGTTSVDAFEATWLPLVPDANQRRVILQVLQGHHLVQIDGPAISITEKGLEYIQWRGPLTGPPA